MRCTTGVDSAEIVYDVRKKAVCDRWKDVLSDSIGAGIAEADTDGKWAKTGP